MGPSPTMASTEPFDINLSVSSTPTRPRRSRFASPAGRRCRIHRQLPTWTTKTASHAARPTPVYGHHSCRLSGQPLHTTLFGAIIPGRRLRCRRNPRIRLRTRGIMPRPCMTGVWDMARSSLEARRGRPPVAPDRLARGGLGCSAFKMNDSPSQKDGRPLRRCGVILRAAVAGAAITSKGSSNGDTRSRPGVPDGRSSVPSGDLI